jgi:hypothetical protein
MKSDVSRDKRQQRMGLIAIIILILASLARVVVKFLPAIKGYLHIH